MVDVDGYFAIPGSGGLSFYPLTPCRVVDTRHVGNGQPFTGELTVDVENSPCGPPATSQGYVFNATVVPQGPLSYLTLWPDPAAAANGLNTQRVGRSGDVQHGHRA